MDGYPGMYEGTQEGPKDPRYPQIELNELLSSFLAKT